MEGTGRLDNEKAIKDSNPCEREFAIVVRGMREFDGALRVGLVGVGRRRMTLRSHDRIVWGGLGTLS